MRSSACATNLISIRGLEIGCLPINRRVPDLDTGGSFRSKPNCQLSDVVGRAAADAPATFVQAEVDITVRGMLQALVGLSKSIA